MQLMNDEITDHSDHSDYNYSSINFMKRGRIYGGSYIPV